MSIRRHFASLAVVGLVVGTLAGPALAAPAPGERPAPADQDDGSYVPGAAALEGRIMAPCCWTQTIDIHGSELANDLRREIRKRLKSGETSDAIEASLIGRYGPRILAVPPGSPLKTIATLLALGMGGAGAAAFAMLKRWRERALVPATGPTPDKGKNDAQLDARLDAELDALDD